MEDWTDIIGEELENIEEPLPADDWSVLQQKYAAAQKKKRAAVFAWAGGFTSVAAAVALVLLLVRPEAAETMNPDLSADADDIVAEVLPPTDTSVPVDTAVVRTSADTVQHVAPSVQKAAPVDVVKKAVEDVLIAEDGSDEIPSEGADELFEVVRDTTSLKSRLLADASGSDKKDAKEDAAAQLTGSSGFNDFQDDEPRRRRKPMSVGMSGSVAGPLSLPKAMDVGVPDMAPGLEGPGYEGDGDSTFVQSPAPVMRRNRSKYNEHYSHEIPISFGVSVRFSLTDRLSVNTGLNYTRYTSTRERYYYTGGDDIDKQYVHYLGIPVRIDWLAVNRKHFNFYIGAGAQADKCIYATVGTERLHEKKVLFGLNGAMGFQVNIVPMVGLYFEPEVTYALNEGTIKTFRDKEPLMITARAGLRFNF